MKFLKTFMLALLILLLAIIVLSFGFLFDGFAQWISAIMYIFVFGGVPIVILSLIISLIITIVKKNGKSKAHKN